MNITIRKSTSNDLLFLESIEINCFPAYQQSSRKSLQNSLSSTFQQVWIAETNLNEQTVPVAAAIVMLHQHTFRLFSIGVLPQFQGQKIGEMLLQHLIGLADNEGFSKVSIEVLEADKKLIHWYQKFGFVVVEALPDYYQDGIAAVKMVLPLANKKTKSSLVNLIVVDEPKRWKLTIENVQVVSSKNYLAEPEFQAIKNARIFNLCNSYRYQSLGYYVSLLASAREHRAIPNVTTIRDFRNVSIIRTIARDIDDLLQKTLENVPETSISFHIYFGQTIDKNYLQLGQNLYRLFETPLMQVVFNKTDRWVIQKVQPMSMDKIDENDFEFVQNFALQYFSKKRFQRQRFYPYKYDLAILVNPTEANPPSNAKALKKFKEAAKKVGFYTEFITNEDYDRLSEFDALFIRETTNVNDYTYHFSRTAYAEGLVVIDDPWSILRCSNKIFLDERMRQNKILTPKTWILTRNSIKKSTLSTFHYPIILKQPDSAFSIGVTKVNNLEELISNLKLLFKKSDLIIAQEFLPSDYDWRIGVLDQKPLFASKYYMAKGHWQIINWDDKSTEKYGDAKAVPIDEVPKEILKTATKAAGLMGDGLYGVDLKMVDNKAYVIEVNDNPNIDAGEEDAILKDKLYLKIMKSMYNRIEMSRNIARFISAKED